MKLVVLGARGQLGIEILRQAKDLQLSVAGFDRQQFDVQDSGKFLSMLDEIQPDVVINTTAFHVVPECERQPAAAFAVNAAAVQSMAECCYNRKIQFVTYSTDYVFDGLKGSPYVETDQPNPLQVYGITKYAGELLVRLYHPDAIIIRTNGVYGGLMGSPSKKGNFVLSILRSSETQNRLEVSKEQTVNPTYAVDLAEATLRLIVQNAPGSMYHLASSGACSWAEFAKFIVSLKQRSMEIVPVDREGRSGAMRRPLFSVLANERARTLGIVLPNWEDAVTRYLQTLP